MMPKISPFSMEKLMFLAASTVPPLVLKTLAEVLYLYHRFHLDHFPLSLNKHPELKLFCFFSCCFCCFSVCICSFIFSFVCCFFCVICRIFEWNNCSVVFLVDEVFDLVRFQSIYQSFDRFAVFVSFFDCDYVYISFCCFRIRSFVCDGVVGYGISSLQCVVYHLIQRMQLHL